MAIPTRVFQPFLKEFSEEENNDLTEELTQDQLASFEDFIDIKSRSVHQWYIQKQCQLGGNIYIFYFIGFSFLIC